jgi:hypothetical protein
MERINQGVWKECYTLVPTEAHQWHLMLHRKFKCLISIQTLQQIKSINKPQASCPPERISPQIVNLLLRLHWQKEEAAAALDGRNCLPQRQPWDQEVGYEVLCLPFHKLANPAIDYPLLCWLFLVVILGCNPTAIHTKEEFFKGVDWGSLCLQSPPVYVIR